MSIYLFILSIIFVSIAWRLKYLANKTSDLCAEKDEVLQDLHDKGLDMTIHHTGNVTLVAIAPNFYNSTRRCIFLFKRIYFITDLLDTQMIVQLNTINISDKHVVCELVRKDDSKLFYSLNSEFKEVIQIDQQTLTDLSLITQHKVGLLQ